MSGLNKEVYIRLIMEQFYEEPTFLNVVRDMTAFVENDAINLAAAGVTPAVLKNNNTYPLSIANISDSAIRLPLDKFSTTPSLITIDQKQKYAFSKVESDTMLHTQALRENCGEEAAYNYSPQADALRSPVLRATGTAASHGNKLTKADVLSLKTRFDKAKIQKTGRYLVLCPEHCADLMNEDADSFNTVTNIEAGVIGRIWGFNIMEYNDVAYYNSAAGTKIALGATPVPGTDAISSFAFQNMEVMKADGSIDVNIDTGRPQYDGGTIINANKFFIGLNLRGAGIGAIHS